MAVDWAGHVGTGVTAARAAGAYLITVPSQPGKQLDGDYITTTLDDDVLTTWAQQSAPSQDQQTRSGREAQHCRVAPICSLTSEIHAPLPQPPGQQAI